MKHISEILNRLIDNIDAVIAETNSSAFGGRKPFVSGIPSGFSDLDHMTTGFQRSDLIVIAGATSSGKTSLALGMAYGAALGHAKNVGVFTLEGSSDQIIQRILSMETGVDIHRLRLGQIDSNEWDRISRAFGRLSEAPIFIDDSVTSITDVRLKALQLKAERGIDLLIIDYLQLMVSAHAETRAQEVSEITRKLKALARELDVPIVVVSQLSRAVERRVIHQPLLTDLRDSGSIEEDADIVLFIYREDMYEADSERKGVAEIIVAKHRNGPVGSIILRFFDRTARFADLELYPVSSL